MTPRSASVAIVLALLLAVGAVQLLDPVVGERHPPAVDFSEPPAEVAADSAARLAFVDYSYRIDIADNRSGPWEQVRVARIEHSDREYRKAGPLGNRGVVIYGTDAAAFARPGSGGDWQLSGHPDTVYPVPALSQPFLVERIRASNASVEAENRSVFVVRIDSNPLKLASVYQGNATVYVNKTDRTLEKVLVPYDSGPRRVSYLRFTLTGTEPTVERPDGLAVSTWELGWDLLRGPLFKPFSSSSSDG